MKKIIVIVLIFIFTFKITIISAQDKNSEWTTKYIEASQKIGILGDFKNISSDSEITRADFAAILAMAFNIKPTDLIPKYFPDVLDNNPMKEAITLVSARGWLSGYEDGKFYPKYNVTRAQAINAISLATETNIPYLPQILPFKKNVANIILKGFYEDHSAIPEWARLTTANASLRSMVILEGQAQGSRFYLRPLDHASFGEVVSLIYLARSKQLPIKFPVSMKSDDTIVTNINNWYLFLYIMAFMGSGILYFKTQFRKGWIYYICKLTNNLSSFQNEKYLFLPILDFFTMCIVGSFIVMHFLRPNGAIQTIAYGLGWTTLFQSLLDSIRS